VQNLFFKPCWTEELSEVLNTLDRHVIITPKKPTFILSGQLIVRIEKNDAATVRQFYDLLVSDDQKELEKRVMDIWEEVLNYEE